MATEKAKRYSLPKRFSAALSESAYGRLRALNAQYGYGNNYLLTILLERLDDVASKEDLDRIYGEFAAEYGAPEPPTKPPTKAAKKKS